MRVLAQVPCCCPPPLRRRRPHSACPVATPPPSPPLQVRPEYIIPLVEELHGKKWPKFNSEKICHIAYGRIQVRVPDHARPVFPGHVPVAELCQAASS